MRASKSTLELFISSPTTFTHKPNISAFSKETRTWLATELSNNGRGNRGNVIFHEDELRYDIPLCHYMEFVRKIGILQNSLRLSAIPRPLLTALQQPLPIITPQYAQQLLEPRIPKALYDYMFEYQRIGTAFVVSRFGRALVCDQMGLGKSIIGQGFLAACRAEWPALVIVPSSLRVQWSRLCQKWFPDIPAARIRVILKSTDVTDGVINIISYDLAARKAAQLLQYNFLVTLADESHFLKSRTSKRSECILPVISRSRRILLLTGTPALSRPSELYTQLNLIRPDLFSNFHRFGVRYCNAQKTKYGYDYNGASNLAELHIVLKATCLIRRTKQDVLAELPLKTRERVRLLLTDEQKSIIRASEVILEKAIAKDPAAQQAAFLGLFRSTCTAKLPSVIEYVWDLLQGQLKFLVFAHHCEMLDGLDDFLQKKKIAFVRIDGKTPQKARATLVDRFQEDGECRVALLSITAAGCGVTLTAATIVVFAELFWTPGSVLQAEDRAHRVGQEEAVAIKYLVAADTADDKIWSMLSRKLRIVGQMLDNKKDGFDATRATFDEEITQTDMQAFIAAISERGRKKTKASLLSPAKGANHIIEDDIAKNNDEAIMENNVEEIVDDIDINLEYEMQNNIEDDAANVVEYNRVVECVEEYNEEYENPPANNTIMDNDIEENIEEHLEEKMSAIELIPTTSKRRPLPTNHLEIESPPQKQCKILSSTPLHEHFAVPFPTVKMPANIPKSIKEREGDML